MTGKQRIQAVLEGRPADRLPVMHVGFSSRVASHILGREAYVGGGVQQWREAAALWNGSGAHAEFVARSRQCLEEASATGKVVTGCSNDTAGRPEASRPWRPRDSVRLPPPAVETTQ